MTAAAYVGVDLAWKDSSRTGLAAVDGAGRLTASGVVKSDDEIAAWIEAHAPRAQVVAVDAPLIVPNASGQRVAEKMIGQAFGRYGASAHSASRSNPLFDPPRAEVLASRFGWEVDPEAALPASRTRCIEVYPHPALVGLFELPQRLLYKKGTDRRSGFLELAACLESVPELRLAESPRWAELLAVIANPARGDLTRIEDELDAILCAHLAWLWEHRRDALTVYGSLTDGYIVAPPPPSHAATDNQASKRTSAEEVVEVWGMRPGPAASKQGEVWADAIRRETAARDLFAPGARLSLTVDFLLPPRVTGNDEWDLDNLLKTTIDGLIALLGVRRVRTAKPQADDERIDQLTASKRPAGPDEQVGARIQLAVCASG